MRFSSVGWRQTEKRIISGILDTLLTLHPLLQNGRFPEFQLFSFSGCRSGQLFGQPLDFHVAIPSKAGQGLVA